MRRLALFLLLAIAGPASYAADKNLVSKSQLFQRLAEEVLLPLTGDFAATADKLADASHAYCHAKQDLDNVQAAWRAAQSAWQPLEMLQIGPIIERRTQRQVNAWPVRPKLLAPLLAESKPIEASRMETLGMSAKGLPALEYLLFTSDRDTPHSAQGKPLAAAHCNVLQALAQHVRIEAQALAADWRTPDGGFARQLTEAGQHPQDGVFASGDQALSDVVNLLIAGLDAVKVRKLGKPLDKSGEEAALERIESWRSGTSLDHVHDNLRGFELVFFGKGKAGIGLDDYLTAIERPGLARVVRRELDSVQKALRAIRAPLKQALVSQRREVEALHKSIGRLQHLLETEVADALKIDLGFNANDGD
jgi:predicted lipoprotein